MAIGQLLAQHVEEQIVLGGLAHARGGTNGRQTRIAAHLPQLGERRENGNRGRRETLLLDDLADLGVRRHTNALVEFALRAGQLDGAEQLGLGRQVFGHLGLHAAQHVGRKHVAQGAQALFVLVLLDGHAEEAREVHLVAQKARVQEVHEGPKLAQVVLHRGAREAKAMGGPQGPHRPVRAAALVLDELRLIEDEHVELFLRQPLFVAVHQGVAGDDDVVLPDAIEGLVTPGAVQQEHAQTGCELFDLALPVEDQAGGRHDEHRAAQATLLLFGGDVRDGLQGFAEPHVVGEDAAHVAGP
jgi:hypothetical protein